MQASIVIEESVNDIGQSGFISHFSSLFLFQYMFVLCITSNQIRSHKVIRYFTCGSKVKDLCWHLQNQGIKDKVTKVSNLELKISYNTTRLKGYSNTSVIESCRGQWISRRLCLTASCISRSEPGVCCFRYRHRLLYLQTHNNIYKKFNI